MGGVLDEVDVGAGPVGDVRDGVLAGVDAEDVANDVGDRLGLDFDPVAGRPASRGSLTARRYVASLRRAGRRARTRR